MCAACHPGTGDLCRAHTTRFHVDLQGAHLHRRHEGLTPVSQGVRSGSPTRAPLPCKAWRPFSKTSKGLHMYVYKVYVLACVAPIQIDSIKLSFQGLLHSLFERVRGTGPFADKASFLEL